MKNEEKTIWIDMTDLSGWQGHFTGIQRVVYNIASRFADTNKNVKYFIFDDRSKMFKIFDFQNFKINLETRLTNDDIELSNRQVVKLKIKQAYLKSPNFVKRAIQVPRIKSSIKKSLQYRHKIKIQYSKNNKVLNKNSIKAVFGTGDTILILGNSWDRPDLVPSLGDLRDEKALKVYQVIYDLIPVYQPQAFNAELFKIYSNNMFEVVTNSDGLLAISESSKRDVLRFCEDLDLTCPLTSVIRLGDDIPQSKKPIKPKDLTISASFVLCVGTIEVRKNHAILYYAWKEGLRKGIKMPQLVIVGRQGWYTGDIIHTIKTDPDTRDKFHLLDNVNDDGLVWLYQNSLFTVYPSYYEGWGLPVAESAAMGKLCISSDKSSMPEIAGSLMEYFSPYNSDELARKIGKYLDVAQRVKKEKEIKSKYNTKSWDDCYQQVRKLTN